MRKAIDYTANPECDVIISEIKNRFNKGLGTNIFVIGLPGTGKSSTCQRIGELVSQELYGENRITEKNIVDNLVDTLDFVINAKEPGQVLIIEEVSVLFPSTRAMSNENLAISNVFDTVRKKQIIMISNAPLLDRIDKHMKALGHIMIETLRINKTNKIVISKALRMQTNPRSGKTYYHRFQRQGKEVHRIYTKLPNQEVWNLYEGKKDKFMGDLYEMLKAKKLQKEEKMLKDLEKKTKVVIVDLTDREKQVYNMVEAQGMKKYVAAEELGIHPSRITRILQNVKKKLMIASDNGQKPPENGNYAVKNIQKLPININSEVKK